MSLFDATRQYLTNFILGAFLGFCPLGASAADVGWHTGQLLQHSSERRDKFRGNGKGSGPIVSVMEVEDGSQLYFMQCTAWMDWSKVPSLTDHTSLRFKVSGRKAYITDDYGVSFRLKIQRIENKISSPQ